MSEETIQEQQSTKKRKKKDKPVVEMSFLEHLEVLRWHIVRASIAVMVCMVVAFLYKDFIFDVVLFSPKYPEFWTNRMLFKLAEYLGTDSLRLNLKPWKFINTEMAGLFSLHIWVSFIVGLVMAAPYVLYEFWKFVRPALYSKERKHASGAVIYMSALFIIGVLFGYYMILPFSIDFLVNYDLSNEVSNQIKVGSYISMFNSIVLASGIVFELPVIIFFLSKIGLVTPEFLKRYRKHAFIILLILAAIITPPDIISQIMVTIPLVILYEVSIVISKRVIKKAAEKEALNT